MKTNFTTISLTTLTAFLVVWVALVSFDWVEEYLASRQSPAYEELPFEFKLKAKPEEVIYSEAYTTGDGRDVVKYAYLAGEVGPQLNEDIARRTPTSYTEVIEQYKDKNNKQIEKLKTTFFSKPRFYRKEGKWRQIEYATTTPDIFSMSGAIPHIKKRELAERLIPGKPVFATVSTYYPDAHTETNSVDGYIYVNTVGTGFSTGEACTNAFSNAYSDSGTLAVASDSSSSMSIHAFAGNTSFEDPDWFCDAEIHRTFVLFNTADLPDNAVISTATLSLYVQGTLDADNDGSDTVNVVSSNPASNTALIAADYDLVGTTLYASAVDITSISTSAYLAISLNSTGIAAVNLTGVSKFGLREGHDLSGTRVNNDTTNSVTFTSADGTDDPKLDVTYTADSYSFGQWFPF
jgi:hypothetical protein